MQQCKFAQSLIIDCSESAIREHLWLFAKPMLDIGEGPCVLSMQRDAVHVPETIQFACHYQAVVGCAAPNHIQYVSDADPSILDEERPKNSADFVCSDGFLLAQELKVVSVTCQRLVPGMPNTAAIAAYPQCKNAVTVLNDTIYNILANLARDHPEKNVFVNGAFDGLSSESPFVTSKLQGFLKGMEPTSVITDANPNMKSMHSQIIGGSSCIICGTVVINPGILLSASVAQNLLQVSNWVSDKLVLDLASHTTIKMLKMKLDTVENCQDGPNPFSAMAFSLCFIHTHLYCANTKELSAETHVMGLWLPMIWLTSLEGISYITKRNLVYETVRLVFVISQSDVYHPHFVMMEPLEHLFGDLRTMHREFTVLEFIDMIDKLVW